MPTELTIVKKPCAEKPAKEKRSKEARRHQRIYLLEMPPQPEWFIRYTTPRGRVVWYVRFTVTGHRARIFGPFPSKRAGLLFLDGAQDKLADFWSEVDDVRNKYTCEGEFEYISWGPIIEHPLAAPRVAIREKGR